MKKLLLCFFIVMSGVMNATVIKNIVAGPTDVVVTKTTASCGMSDGTITLGTVTGGVAPFTYSIDADPYSGSTTFNGLAPATYSVNVKDSNGDVFTKSVTIFEETVVPTFNSIPPICAGDPAPPLQTTSNNGVTGSWTPSMVSNTSSGTYTFTPNGGQCAGTVTMNVTVINPTTPTFNSVPPICSGDTPPTLPTTSNNGIPGFWNPSTVDNTVSGTYTFTPNAGQCATETTINVTVNPSTVPTFNPVGPFCEGETVPAGSLPTTSTNAINGTWNPSTISNTASGTYTFTPDAGECADMKILNVTVNSKKSTTINCGTSTASSVQFDWTAVTGATGYDVTYQVNSNTPVAIGSVGTTTTYTVNGLNDGDSVEITVTPTGGAGSCLTFATQTCIANGCTPSTANISYDTPFCISNTTSQLPSLNSTGSQSGATYTADNGLLINVTTGAITPSENAVGNYTVTYTIPGAAPGCPDVTATTTVVIVESGIEPTFTAVEPICTGDTPPTLPTTSNNGISGTWSPSTVSNTASGIYTFTPDAGQCATTTTLDITVNSSIVPTFDAVEPICSGDIPPVLPNISTNSPAISGTWDPPTVSNTISGTYTFTPAAGQCANPATLDVTVYPSIVPDFSPIAPICSGDTAPTLPATSNNGLNGTWSPSTVSNTASGTYTFTPDAGNCTAIVTLDVTVNPVLSPTVNCGVSTTSAIQFTWSAVSGATAYDITYQVNANTPVVVGSIGNVLFYDVTGLAADDSVTITVMPTGAAGTCFASSNQTCVAINCTPPTVSISYYTPFCASNTSPQSPNQTGTGAYTGGTYSANGGLPIDPTTGYITPNISGTFTITYTVVSCTTTTATTTVVIEPEIEPTFNQPAPICSGGVAPTLPTTSNNGITGTWNPFTVSNTATGTYTFTPDAGQCADMAMLNVTVNAILSPTINCGVSTTSSVQFNWGAVTGATGYTVSYEVNGTAPIFVGSVGNVLTYTVNGITPGDSVTITVTPTGGSGSCFASSTQTCITNSSSIIELTMNGIYNDYNADGFTNVGDVINYQFTVTNNGASDITNISISNFNMTTTGSLAVLAVGTSDSTTFTAVHVINQTDITNGYVTVDAQVAGAYNSTNVNDVATTTTPLSISDGIKLNAFIDNNSNGVQDGGESNYYGGEFHYELNNDGTVHNISSSYGMHTIYESNSANSYDVSFSTNNSGYTVNPSSYNDITVANGSGITMYNFPLTAVPYKDLAVYLYQNGAPPRPGFTYDNYIYVSNRGNQTTPAGTLTFTNDSRVTITNVSPSATMTATGFTYDYPNLAPNEYRYVIVTMQVPTIPTVQLGDQLTNTVSTTIPAGDVDTANNNASLTQTIVGSYDPNDKNEAHGPQILHSTFTSNDYLSYTIQFENTGTANAVTVRVEDVLEAKLDETSIKMIDASHNYTLDRVGSDLTWTFDGIELPPSVEGTSIGKGYINFQIKPKAGFAIGDIIKNTAYIYFDFNPAIVTNEFSSEFVETLGVTGFENTLFSAYPNPTKGLINIALKNNANTIDSIIVTDVLGKTVQSNTIHNSTATIDISNLTKGLYFVKIQAEGQVKTLKVVKE